MGFPARSFLLFLFQARPFQICMNTWVFRQDRFRSEIRGFFWCSDLKRVSSETETGTKLFRTLGFFRRDTPRQRRKPTRSGAENGEEGAPRPSSSFLLKKKENEDGGEEERKEMR